VLRVLPIAVCAIITGENESSGEPMTVFIYVNRSRQVGDPEHLKVFANVDAAEKWFEENDPWQAPKASYPEGWKS
jgi:hypothetical protein